MRVKNINLSWFRGAGESVNLDTDNRNVVVYGANGAGKSSFADALEYIIEKGRIQHLVDKRIGSKQEKGIVNTHRPTDSASTATINFDDGSKAYVQISCDGQLIFGSEPEEFINLVQTWQLERLLLRQDEVANFIIKTPGGKYSVLLPLLGLGDLEIAADNTTNLSKYISETSELLANRSRITDLKRQIDKYFTDTLDASLLSVLKTISEYYGVTVKWTESIFKISEKLHKSILVKFNSIAPEISRHSTFNRIFNEDLPCKLSNSINKQNEIKDKIDTLLDIRIGILEKSETYNENLEEGVVDIYCPACGSAIRRENFKRHVKDELSTLKNLCSARDQATEARNTLKDSISRMLVYANDRDFMNWLDQEPQHEFKESLLSLTKLNEKRWEDRFTSETQTILSRLIPIINKSVEAEKEKTPASNINLLEDIATLEAINVIPELRNLENRVMISTKIINALNSSTSAIRETIRTKTENVISQISHDIQYLWSILHPNELIEDIELYLPEEGDKSIDVGLKFYGIGQPSPRFTLSEGHRNSLGLCIFLALARLETNMHLPIFLDDIVSSLDRQHRGNVTELLKNEFGDRQILLFTHDREWFTELSMLLPPKAWKKLVLKPWKEPGIGMQWSTSEFTFDDARDYIESNCELAGNCARQIMDTQTAIAAEKLMIKIPYARGDKNDHRTGVEFLEYIISSAKKSLKIRKSDNEYVSYSEPLEHWKDTRNRLIVRGNRGSHTGSLVRNEVEDLISVCERSINFFKCDTCGDFIWIANQEGRELLQCSCGTLRWKYG